MCCAYALLEKINFNLTLKVKQIFRYHSFIEIGMIIDWNEPTEWNYYDANNLEKGPQINELLMTTHFKRIFIALVAPGCSFACFYSFK